MTNLEVVAELRSLVKPHLYVHVSQQLFSRTIINIEADTAKNNTIRAFFKLFGYEGDYNNWRLKDGSIINGMIRKSFYTDAAMKEIPTPKLKNRKSKRDSMSVYRPEIRCAV